MLMMCLLVLAFLALVNMRGVKDTGAAFILPTFLFVGTVLTTVAFGVFRVVAAHGHPVARAEMPHALPATIGYLSVWLALKSFSNGCAAMTGVEAVSNGVMAFREPRVRNAQMALTVIMGTLVVMLFGTAWLAKQYGIMAMDPAQPGYQSLLLLIVMAVFGRSWFFHFTMWPIFLALTLSANTAFADFPRVTRAVALNDFLPHVFVLRGRRLLYSYGIYALTAMTAIILIKFSGNIDNIISSTPLEHSSPSLSPSPAWWSTGRSRGANTRAASGTCSSTAPARSPPASPHLLCWPPSSPRAHGWSRCWCLC